MVVREQTPVAGPETEQLLRKEDQAPDEPACDPEEFMTAPEYLQRLDDNVRDLLLLPSHYAREDYIAWLRDLKRSDGARTILAKTRLALQNTQEALTQEMLRLQAGTL